MTVKKKFLFVLIFYIIQNLQNGLLYYFLNKGSIEQLTSISFVMTLALISGYGAYSIGIFTYNKNTGNKDLWYILILDIIVILLEYVVIRLLRIDCPLWFTVSITIGVSLWKYGVAGMQVLCKDSKLVAISALATLISILICFYNCLIGCLTFYAFGIVLIVTGIKNRDKAKVEYTIVNCISDFLAGSGWYIAYMIVYQFMFFSDPIKTQSLTTTYSYFGVFAGIAYAISLTNASKCKELSSKEVLQQIKLTVKLILAITVPLTVLLTFIVYNFKEYFYQKETVSFCGVAILIVAVDTVLDSLNAVVYDTLIYKGYDTSINKSMIWSYIGVILVVILSLTGVSVFISIVVYMLLATMTYITLWLKFFKITKKGDV